MSRSVFLIRHGQSTFNVAASGGVDPIHVDARLTARGHEQVREARRRMSGVHIDLVVVSPLTRALETAVGIFEGHASAPTLLVEALHREHGGSSCDVGRMPAVLAVEFPQLDFAHLPELWWETDDCAERDWRGVRVEPLESCERRVARFRQWLLARPEAAITVVGHFTFFRLLTGGRTMANGEVLEWAPERNAAGEVADVTAGECGRGGLTGGRAGRRA